MTQQSEAQDPVSMLGNLISKYYNKLEQDENFEPKIGDLIKMIEARRKLSPVDADQKEFWSMLEEIRKKKMGKKTASPRTRGKGSKKST